MIPSRIALLVAPWCLVLLIAIGCSKREILSDNRELQGKQDGDSLTAIMPAVVFEQDLVYPDLYAELVRNNTDPVKLRAELAPFYKRWGQQDGVSAINHALKQHQSLLSESFGGWLEADPAAAREFVLGFEGAARNRGRLAEGLLHALPSDDFNARSEWVEHFAEEKYGSKLVTQVAIGWGRSQPGDTIDWLKGLPSGNSRSGAIETVFREWTNDDPEVASSHLTGMVEGEAKDLAISALAKSISRDDPDAALLWADTIVDPEFRDRTNSLLIKLGSPRPISAPVPTPSTGGDF